MRTFATFATLLLGLSAQAEAFSLVRALHRRHQSQRSRRRQAGVDHRRRERAPAGGCGESRQRRLTGLAPQPGYWLAVMPPST